MSKERSLSGRQSGPDENGDRTLGTAERGYTWKVGPSESQPVRVCLYLAEGLLGGLLLFWLVSAGRSSLPDALAGGPWTFGVALFALVLARWAWYWLWFRRRIRDESNDRLWLMRDWLAASRPSLLAGVVLFVGVGLLALDPNGLRFGRSDGGSIWFGLLLVAAAFSALAGLLSSKGELDPDSLTLSTFRYGRWRELDLRLATDALPVTVGDQTVVWLSIAPGVEKRTATQGFYAIPAEIFERSRTAFEAGAAADPPLDPEKIERARFFRKVNRAVAVGCFGLAAAALAVLVWFGTPLWNALQLFWAVAVFGAILLKIAI